MLPTFPVGNWLQNIEYAAISPCGYQIPHIYLAHPAGNDDKIPIILPTHPLPKSPAINWLLLRASRNEKEMKVKPATSFKLLTIFIPQKIKQDSKQKNVSKQYLSSLYH